MGKGLLFTLVATYLGAPVALFRPYVGLLIYICFAIIKPDVLWSWSVPEGNYSRIIALATIGGWFLHRAGNWTMGRSWLTLGSLLTYFTCVAFSTVFGAEQGECLTAGKFLSDLGKIVLPFVMGITLINSLGKLKGLCWTIALSQGYVAFEMNFHYYHGFNWPTQSDFGGMDNNCIAVAMVTGAGLAFFLGISEKRLWLKGLAFLTSALEAHVIMFAMSRGAMVALVVTGMVAFVMIPKRPAHLACLLLAAFLALRLAGPDVRDRFATIMVDTEKLDTSAQSRLEMWQLCLETMRAHPLVGIGPDSWISYVRRVKGVTCLAHSVWMQTGADSGLVALGLLATFFGSCAIRLWPLTREDVPVPHPWYRDAARMAIAAITGYVVAGQFVSLNNLEIAYYVTLFGACTVRLWSTPLGWSGWSEEYFDQSSTMPAPSLGSWSGPVPKGLP